MNKLLTAFSSLTEITDPIFSRGLSLCTRFVQLFLSLVHKAKPKMGSVIFVPSLMTVAIVFFWGCGKEDDGNLVNGSKENIAGTYYRTLTTETDNQERKFIVYIPETAQGNQEVPVLFFIHGTSQNGQFFYENPDLWTSKADEEGFIVVYPTGLRHCHYDNGEERNVTKWASGELGETDISLGALPLCPGQSLADDMLFFDKMVEVLKNEYTTDAKRFYVTGFSNGANMTSRLAAERAEVFAAAAVYAGYLSAFIPPNLSARPMSMLLSVGANDGLFAEATGLTVPIAINASLVNNPGVANILNPFLEINGLDTLYTYAEVQVDGLNVGSFFFQNSNIGLDNSVRFFVIPGLAHSYTDLLIDPFWTFLAGESLP